MGLASAAGRIRTSYISCDGLVRHRSRAAQPARNGTQIPPSVHTSAQLRKNCSASRCGALRIRNTQPERRCLWHGPRTSRDDGGVKREVLGFLSCRTSVFDDSCATCSYSPPRRAMIRPIVESQVQCVDGPFASEFLPAGTRGVKSRQGDVLTL